MPEPLTVALAGCGRWGRLILRDLVELGCRVAVATPSEASRQAALAIGAWRVAPDVGDLPDVAGAVVAAPTIHHAAVTTKLLARGLKVFVEKPLTPDPVTSRLLAETAGERVFVMDKWRYHPCVEELARIARGGELGPILSLTTTRINWGNPHPDVHALWTLAPHDLSIGLEVLGFLPEPRYARAEIIDSQPVSLVGVLGDEPFHVIDISTRAPLKRREVRLSCLGGVASFSDGYAEAVEVVRADGAREMRSVSAELPLRRELRAFLDHLRGGPPPRSSAAEGAAIVESVARLCELAGVPNRGVARA
jgi:predicted dehydrogenase